MTTTKLAVGVKEAAEMVSVPERMIWTEIAEGRLRSFKQGKRRLIRVVSLDAWAERREMLNGSVIRLPVGPRASRETAR